MSRGEPEAAADVQDEASRDRAYARVPGAACVLIPFRVWGIGWYVVQMCWETGCRRVALCARADGRHGLR